MTQSEIYLRAAELIAAGYEHYSCTAISAVEDQLGYGPARLAYIAMMAPRKDDNGRPYLSVQDFNGPRSRARHHRVVALCLMAAIVARPRRKK